MKRYIWGNKFWDRASRENKIRSIGCWSKAELEEKLKDAKVHSRGEREIPIYSTIPSPRWVPYVIPAETRKQYFAIIYDRRQQMLPVQEERRNPNR